MVKVVVSDKSKLYFAIRSFKKKTQREGIIKEAKLREAYEKPSVKRKRKKQENIARRKERAVY